MTSNARASQSVIEPLVVATRNVRVSQAIIEPLVAGNPNVRASQSILEPLVTALKKLRCSQIVLEVLCALENPVPPIYPTLPGLGYNVKWSPVFFNMPTETADSGADIDLALASTPLHDFELVYDFLRDRSLPNFLTGGRNNEFRTLFAFFLQLQGTVGRFFFKNPDDHRVTQQAIGTTDGVNSVFGPLVRTFADGPYSATEPVGGVDTTKPFNVYLNGVLQDPVTYSVLTGTPLNQQIKFASTPTAGQSIAVDMSYYYYCKFKESTYTFEKFLDRLWLIQKVTLHSCRQGA